MININFLLFTFLMSFSLIFISEAEGKSQHKSSLSHSKSSHSVKHSSSKSNKQKSSVNQRVNNVFQINKKNFSQAKISQNARMHIKNRHWYNANPGAGTSLFNHSMTDKKLNNLATKTIQNGSKRPSTHGQGRITYQYRFNKPIGTTTSGQQARSLRVVTDTNSNVITAFPVK